MRLKSNRPLVALLLRRPATPADPEAEARQRRLLEQLQAMQQLASDQQPGDDHEEAAP